MQFNNLIYRIFISTALITGLFLASCKKIENQPQPQTSSNIKRVATEDESMVFEYNTDGTLHKATIKNDDATNGDIIHYNISYNAAKQIAEVVSDNNEKIIPVYENGVLVRSFLKTSAGVDLGFTEYENFNANNKAATFYTEVGGIIYPLTMLLFKYDEAGNIVKTNLYVQNPVAPNSLLLTGSITYSYDTKNNPLAKASDFLKLLWIAVPNNNVLTEIHKDKDGGLEETIEYVYQYNSKNYPVSGTVKRVPATGTTETKNILFDY
ncbi:MAG: hypothetical protein QM725_00295 [Lacibacter sp.]